MDEISDLRLFTMIVAAGSLSETARRTSGSLPAMSRRLAKIEARLGAKLIDRGSRHFVLTQEGLLLHRRALHVLGEIDAIEAELAEGIRSPRGHLRIGAPHEIGRHTFAGMLADFTERHPGVSVELVLTDEKLEKLDGDFDIGLHIDVPERSTSIVRKLLTSRRVLCASPEFLNRHGRPNSVEDLARYTCVKLVRSGQDHDRWMYVADGQIREHFVSAALSTNCSDVMHQWAVAGRGIVQKALWDIEADLSAGRLVAILEKQFCMELCLYVTYSPSTPLPARTRMMIDHIAQALTAPKA